MDFKLLEIQYVIKFDMKNYEYSMMKQAIICFSLLAISFVIHFSIILFFQNDIISPEDELFSGAKRNIILGVSYIGPLMLAMSGLKIAWTTYEENLYSGIYNLYIILMILNVAIILGVDKFILNII